MVVLAHNFGRSDSLLHGTAVLKVGAEQFKLVGLAHSRGLRVYSGQYFHLKAMGVEELNFSQHPDETNRTQLARLYDQMRRDAGGTLELRDVTGNVYQVRGVRLRSDAAG